MFKLPKIETPDWLLQKFQLPKVKIPKLKIGDSISDIPIIQGGMGVGISLSGLASAVAREGGVGVIAANAIGMLEPDYFKNGRNANKRALRKEIRKAREKSSGIIGVNIMVAVKDFEDLLRVSIEEKVDVVFVGAGLPIRGIPVKELREANVKFVPIVSSGRAAKLICRYWEKNYNDIPDGLVVEGPDAGGHLGFKKEQIDHPDHKLEKILPEVISETKAFEKIFNRKIPVIAAGGIFTGEDIYKFLNLGAAGVQMGTRFVATHECDADTRFKKLYLECSQKDIVIIKSPVGLPGRAIKNNFIEDIDSGKKQSFTCPWRCLDSCDVQNARYCISIALNNARKGNFRYGFAFAGSNAYKINRIISVKELLKDLTKEYLAAAEKGTISLLNELTVALEKLNTLKDEYAKTVDKNIRIFKDEYVKVLEKGSETLREEYGNILMKINNLKKEYMDYFNKVNSLKSQLSKFFT